MILDAIENIEQYAQLSPRFAKAVKFLQEHKAGGLPAGRIEISDGVYASSQYYTTKLPGEGKYEAHRIYADVQYVVKGAEQVGWQLLERMNAADYNIEKDAMIPSGEGEMLPLTAGNFMILYPSDAHMPGMAIGTPQPVEKIVVKVKL